MMISAYLPTNAALYYNITMSPAIALFFGWVSLSRPKYSETKLTSSFFKGVSLLGFSFAAMVRPILIDDPQFIFPLSMQQVAVYRSIQGTSELHLERSRKQMRVSSFRCQGKTNVLKRLEGFLVAFPRNVCLAIPPRVCLPFCGFPRPLVLVCKP